MAQVLDITSVVIGPKYLQATVQLAEDAPLTTDLDVEATARVYHVMPGIIDHVCMGDAGETFKDAMPHTELAHLLEHVAVELLAQTGLAGDISCGRTYKNEDADRSYIVQLSCSDDVLVASALSSAVWILNWAYSGGESVEPNVEAIVEGMRALVSTATKMVETQADEPAEQEVTVEDVIESEVEPKGEPAEDPVDKPADTEESNELDEVDEPEVNEKTPTE